MKMKVVFNKKKVVCFGLSLILLIGLVILYRSWVLQDITIIYTTDIHGRLGPSRKFVFPGSGSAEELGGFASLATYLKGRDIPADYILLDAGDFYQGTLEGEYSRGRSVLHLMNELSYDAVTIGNHDFHDGLSNLFGLSEVAEFPLLGGNVLSIETANVVEWLEPYAVLEIDGTRVGIVGVTIPQEDRDDVTFAPYIATADRYVSDLREQGVRLIVLLSHLGFSTSRPQSSPDYQLAREVRGIDVIIGGHYHATLDPPYEDQESGTVICQAGSHLTHVGRLNLKYNRLTGCISGYTNTITPLWAKEYPADEEIKRIVAKEKSRVDEVADEVLGYARKEILSRWTSSPMGALITNLMRDKTQADVAFINKSGLRNSIHQGEITYADIYKALPFTNKLICLELSGSQVKDMLEEDASSKEGRRHFSGLTAVYDLTREVGERVTEIKIGDRPVHDEKIYRICTIDFLTRAIPAYKERDALENASIPIEEMGIGVRDLLIQHVKDNYYVSPPTDVDRIQILQETVVAY